MIPRLPPTTLESAITGHCTLEALCGTAFALLEGLRVADYIGSYRMRPGSLGEHDLMAASAQVFFEEDGVFLSRLDGVEYGREYSVLVFATFLVVEFNAFTPEAHFLVLAPALDAAEGARYHGLWAAQRIEHLQAQLRRADAGPTLFAEVDRLLQILHATPQLKDRRRGHWPLRLFRQRQTPS